MRTMSAIQMKGDLQDYYQRKLGEAHNAGAQRGSQQVNSSRLRRSTSGRKI